MQSREKKEREGRGKNKTRGTKINRMQGKSNNKTSGSDEEAKEENNFSFCTQTQHTHIGVYVSLAAASASAANISQHLLTFTLSSLLFSSTNSSFVSNDQKRQREERDSGHEKLPESGLSIRSSLFLCSTLCDLLRKFTLLVSRWLVTLGIKWMFICTVLLSLRAQNRTRGA